MQIFLALMSSCCIGSQAINAIIRSGKYPNQKGANENDNDVEEGGNGKDGNEDSDNDAEIHSLSAIFLEEVTKTK